MQLRAGPELATAAAAGGWGGVGYASGPPRMPTASDGIHARDGTIAAGSFQVVNSSIEARTASIDRAVASSGTAAPLLEQESSHESAGISTPTPRSGSSDRLQSLLENVGTSPASLLLLLQALVAALGGDTPLQQAVLAVQQLAKEAQAATPAVAVAAEAAGSSGAGGGGGGGDASSPATPTGGASSTASPSTSTDSGTALGAAAAKPTPAQLFGRAARSSHLSYAELLNSFAASATGVCVRACVCACVPACLPHVPLLCSAPGHACQGARRGARPRHACCGLV